MYDIICIGTLTVDLYFKSENLTHNENRFELALGGKYFTDYFHESLGGGATNVAIGLQRHGIQTSLITLLGENSFKPMITQQLQKEGVSYLHSKRVENHLNISCIMLASSGEKTVINYQTPHQHLFTDDEEYEHLSRAQMVYIGNIPDVSFYEKLKLIKYLKKIDKKVIVNLGVIDCRRSKEQILKLLEYIDVLIVNAHEFADMMKTSYKRLNLKKDIVAFFFKEYKEKVFIITDGENGSYGYNEGNIFLQEGIKPKHIIDSTGAGDGYSAGFVAEYFKSKDVKRAMLSGAEYAGKVLSRIGAH